MDLAADVRMYTRFALGLRPFLRRRMTLADARRLLRDRMATRGERFLALVERGVFARPRSPYAALLRLAGCEFGDLQRLVERDGVEGALTALHEAGVYVTFDEFKGRHPIVRHGREIPTAARDFDNPHVKRHYEARTSGSTGRATRIPIDLDHLEAVLPHRLVTMDAHGLVGVPTAIWFGILPGSAGMNSVLRSVVEGNTARRWFSPVTGGEIGSPLTYRLATRFVTTAGRLMGTPLPRPIHVRIDRPWPVVQWAMDTLRREGACFIVTYCSLAMRVCVAARRRGVDLTGATFMSGGEPPTPAKVAEITRTGARFLPIYATSEAGRVAMPCARPTSVNDVHVARDAVAVIQRPRRVPGWDVTVGALYLTSLSATAPKLLLNVETDDCATLEARSCGCPLEACGFTDHLSDIRSYRKLTGEGVSLVSTEVVRVIEEVLPARFGGTPLDYQMREEEDGRGFTRLSLVVHPRIPLASEDDLRSVVLQALRRGSLSGAFAAAYWDQGASLRVRRAAPEAGAGGKFMPLCVARTLAAEPVGERM